jgi:hypothetical protein
MADIRNKYEKNCCECGKLVKVGQGIARKRKNSWDVLHDLCVHSYNKKNTPAKPPKLEVVIKPQFETFFQSDMKRDSRYTQHLIQDEYYAIYGFSSLTEYDWNKLNKLQQHN